MNTSESGTLLILSPCLLRQDLWKECSRHLRGSRIDLVINLSRVSDGEVRKLLAPVQVVTPSERLTEISRWLNRPFASFISSIPRAMGGVGSGFLSPVTRRVPSSVWAISSLAEKNNKVHPSFFFACVGEYLKEKLEGSDLERAIVFASRSSGYHFFETLCPRLGLDVLPMGKRCPAACERSVEWLKVGLKRIRVLVRFLVTKVLLTGMKRVEGEEVDVWFYTQFSRTWLEQGGSRFDRFYWRLPRVLAQTSRQRIGYLVNVGGTHFVRQVGDIARDIRHLRSTSSLVGASYCFLEAYMRMSDALRFLLSPAYLMLFGRLLRNRSRPAFEFRGMDLSHVMRSEVFASMIRVPVNLLYMEAVRRFVTERRARDLIHPFFEYSWGKAILYGAADSEFECRNIAIQHGCFASNLLVAINDPQDFRDPAEGGNGIHLPLATGYYIDGSIPESCLTESGYPEDRLFALGAPRFDTLGTSKEGGVSREVTDIVAKVRSESGRIMLLVPVPNDMQQFAAFMEDALADLDPEGYLFLWKFPPNVSHKGREDFAAHSPFLAQGHALIVEAPIYHLMNLADTVVTTLSTAGLEALEMGKDVVCVSLPGGLNLSPLIDGGDSVPIVYDPTELSGVSGGLDRTGAEGGKLAGRQITGQVGNAAERIVDHMTCVFLDSDAGLAGEKSGREQGMC